MLRNATTVLACLLALQLPGQLHQAVLPELQGAPLLEALQNEYQPSSVLAYGDARDTLFGKIDLRNDTLYCVYTNYAVDIPPGSDPTVSAFQDGDGINTEHAYPRGKGADGFRREANMHNLFPTRVDVNADRGSFPYAEVPDDQAIHWYYLGQTVNFQPAADSGQFSELGEMTFEPPDQYKGDIARAIFYFYTMYRQEADAADPIFFEQQRTTLCLWQQQDPVDEREWDRTHAIASYQQDKENPFVLDCTLATRCYCEDVVPPCTPPVGAKEAGLPRLKLQAVPNPARGQLVLHYELPKAGKVVLELRNALGQLIQRKRLGAQNAGEREHRLVLPEASGIYLCRLRLEQEAEAVLRLLVR
jgi:hypothetical protein